MPDVSMVTNDAEARYPQLQSACQEHGMMGNGAVPLGHSL